LKAINAVRPLAAGRLTTVFGCGGDRDKGKRAEMGRVAAEHSDIVYITSDNPRTEDPLSIVGQIEEGVREVGLNRLPGDPGRSSDAGYRIVPDRREAIRQAVLAAGREDWVLIAGKGHETYQIIGTRKTDFDDRRVAAQAVREVA
jgi:UDP-N-acetylmuramoyl-L-alanyl-D-glutamate--2,6-diaminopimelate ligase